MNRHESRLQQQCFMWHWNNYVDKRRRLFMVHNSPKNAREGALLVGMGMVAGVADLCYIDDGGVAHFLEIKTPNGRMSAAQRKFRDAVLAAGAHYVVIRTFEQFKQYINDAENDAID